MEAGGSRVWDGGRWAGGGGRNRWAQLRGLIQVEPGGGWKTVGAVWAMEEIGPRGGVEAEVRPRITVISVPASFKRYQGCTRPIEKPKFALIVGYVFHIVLIISFLVGYIGVLHLSC